jgi:ribose transport system permease protein
MSPAGTQAPPQRSPRPAGVRAHWLRPLDYGFVLMFCALFVALSLASSSFLTSTNLLNLLSQNAPIGIAACGATLVVIAGGFDLSVGAIYAFSGVVAAKVANAVDPVTGLVAGVLAGLLLGCLNGALVTQLKVNTFIATLASGFVIRGAATLLTGGLLISVPDAAFATLGRDEILSVKVSIVVFAVVALVTSLLLTRTIFGRYVFATGGNAEAARLSGVRVDVVRTATFALSGLCAGLGGVIAASRVSTGQADTGTGLELAVIAAIAIGGTSIMGGDGAIWRSVLGVLFVAMIANGFNILNIDPFYQSIAQGVIILFAVAVDRLGRSGEARRLRRAAERDGPVPDSG